MPKKPQDSHGLTSGAHILGPVTEENTLEKTHAPQPSQKHYFQEPNHRSDQQENQRWIFTDNTMWYNHTRERYKSSEKEERVPPAATKKDLARTPGSQASQTEEDQYHTLSLPGGSSKFNHIDSLRKETPTHTLKTHLVRLEKPQRGIIRSLHHHRHTDIKTGLHKDLQIRTGNPTHPPVQPRQTGKMP